MKSESSLWSQLRGVYFFLTLFVFSCNVLETEDVPRFRISPCGVVWCGVGELGAVFREGKISTSIVLVFGILSS